MRTIRSFTEQALPIGTEVELEGHAAQHLVRVLRLRPGDAVVLFNGDGHDYRATLSQVGKRGCSAMIESAQAVHNESPLRLHLLQAIARGEKMDLILQKATELGVSEITPIVTERTEVKLDAERSEKRLAHWNGVLRSACEQSGRTRVPLLNPPIGLGHCLADLAPAQRAILHPKAEQSLSELRPDRDCAVQLLIGPEGGLSERDLQAADVVGFRRYRLGPRILRTETAGLVALAVLQAKAGDLAA
ncbi:16S rRNA (uracil(1498)-N(3))-methyltransferase [Pseudomarimonas arenosa]|uniref:Ribosomal RNA small subunit methyltransferase E n=1 Tax=Pseudomarimonas arenosa TaxID=2774145 RepID=A0AAW3ZIF4_9GAMM|nr:16S rRNA (uracil(1498)-N(3))-methyltransferase [Pseudomarimonas arenosa]MBD8525563.1 16S rRNA (uracil(1498)-N(3))-methyltransferase [Pseudomarimonas arenosa]